MLVPWLARHNPSTQAYCDCLIMMYGIGSVVVYDGNDINNINPLKRVWIVCGPFCCSQITSFHSLASLDLTFLTYRTLYADSASAGHVLMISFASLATAKALLRSATSGSTIAMLSPSGLTKLLFLPILSSEKIWSGGHYIVGVRLCGK